MLQGHAGASKYGCCIKVTIFYPSKDNSKDDFILVI